MVSRTSSGILPASLHVQASGIPPTIVFPSKIRFHSPGPGDQRGEWCFSPAHQRLSGVSVAHQGHTGRALDGVVESVYCRDVFQAWRKHSLLWGRTEFAEFHWEEVCCTQPLVHLYPTCGTKNCKLYVP
jgi:hypothetical protein